MMTARTLVAIFFAFVCISFAKGSAAMWSPPQTLSSPTQNGNLPHVAINANDLIVAVWTENYRSVQAAIFNSHNWGPAQTLNPVTQNGAYPQIAVSANGSAIATWLEYNKTARLVQAAVFNGSTWNPAQTLSSVMEDGWAAQVEMSANGSAVIVWDESTAEIDFVQAAIFNGKNWNPTQTLGWGGENPRVAMNASGLAAAAWTLDNGEGIGVVQATTFDGNNWSRTQTLSSTPIGITNEAVQLAMSANGSAIATWISGIETNNTVQAAIFNGNNWSPPQTLSSTVEIRDFPQIAMSANGSAVAVWTIANGEATAVQAAIFNGNNWSPAQTLSSPMQNGAYSNVAMSANSSAIATWIEGNGQGADVVQAAVFNGSNWSPAQTLSSPTQIGSVPQVSMSANDSAAVMWAEGNETNAVVQVANFNGSGWDSAQTLSSTPIELLDGPQITMNANGSAVIVWVETLGDTYTVQAATFPYGLSN